MRITYKFYMLHYRSYSKAISTRWALGQVRKIYNQNGKKRKEAHCFDLISSSNSYKFACLTAPSRQGMLVVNATGNREKGGLLFEHGAV